MRHPHGFGMRSTVALGIVLVAVLAAATLGAAAVGTTASGAATSPRAAVSDAVRSRAAASATETITLHPLRDATLIEDMNGALATGSGTGIFAGNIKSSKTRRAVLWFDLENAIATGATIHTVELKLHVDSAPSSDTVSVSLHRVLANWGEGASASGGGAGAAAETGDATWLHRFYPDSSWTAPGGDFESTEAARADVGPSGFWLWSDPGLAELVQSWVDAPPENFGLLLQGNENASSTVRRFDSREHAVAEYWPALVITFTPGDTPVHSTSWGAIKRAWVNN